MVGDGPAWSLVCLVSCLPGRPGLPGGLAIGTTGTIGGQIRKNGGQPTLPAGNAGFRSPLPFRLGTSAKTPVPLYGDSSGSCEAAECDCLHVGLERPRTRRLSGRTSRYGGTQIRYCTLVCLRLPPSPSVSFRLLRLLPSVSSSPSPQTDPSRWLCIILQRMALRLGGRLLQHGSVSQDTSTESLRVHRLQDKAHLPTATSHPSRLPSAARLLSSPLPQHNGQTSPPSHMGLATEAWEISPCNESSPFVWNGNLCLAFLPVFSLLFLPPPRAKRWPQRLSANRGPSGPLGRNAVGHTHMCCCPSPPSTVRHVLTLCPKILPRRPAQPVRRLFQRRDSQSI